MKSPKDTKVGHNAMTTFLCVCRLSLINGIISLDNDLKFRRLTDTVTTEED